MRRFLLSILCLICLCAPSVQAQPVIAARLSVQPQGATIASRLAALAPALLPDIGPLQRLEAFLVSADSGRTLQPIIFIADSPQPLRHLFPGATFHTMGNGWQYLTYGGYTPAEADLVDLLALAQRPTPAPVYAVIYPSVIHDSLSQDPRFTQAIEASALPAILRELNAVSELQLRFSQMGPQTLRLVALARTDTGSALHELFSQRLPTEPSYLQAYISTLLPSGEIAPAYGYTLFNSSAVATYYRHLVSSRAIPDTLAGPLSALALQIIPAAGHIAFVFDGQLGASQLITGHWTTATAPTLIQAITSLIPASDQTTPILTRDAFYIGSVPVWKIYRDIVAADTPPTPHNLGFFALSSGDIICAPTAEGMTRFIDTLQASDPSPTSLTKAFTHYPTICLQAKVHPQRLALAVEAARPFSLPRGLAEAVSSLTNDPIYIAASLGSGQLGVTFDIPTALLDQLGAIVGQ